MVRFTVSSVPFFVTSAMGITWKGRSVLCFLQVKFVGQPWDSRVGPDEYNLCANMMPLLKTERRTLSEADKAELQPILTHICQVLCAGSEPDCDSLIAWLAHVVQDPAEKTGWCPVIISGQGTGKGMIFSSLVGGIFAELGLHVTVSLRVCNDSCRAALTICVYIAEF